MGQLARGLGARIGGRLVEQPHQAAGLGGGDVAVQLRHERLEVLGVLVGELVGLGHQGREQVAHVLVVPRPVTEHYPPRYPSQRAVERLELEAPAGGFNVLQELRRLLPRRSQEPVGQPVQGLAGVEHRLGEAAPVLPPLAARDRQGVRLEVGHPPPLGVGIGRERVGRALEDPAHVVDRQQQERLVRAGPDP
jgi:hypothetical protein